MGNSIKEESPDQVTPMLKPGWEWRVVGPIEAFELRNELKPEVKKGEDVGMVTDKMMRRPGWLQNHLE